MNYSEAASQLRELKKNRKKMPTKEVLQNLIRIIGTHPDAISIFGDMRWINTNQMQRLRENGVSGWGLAQTVLKQMEIRTTNSMELSIKMFGYNKPITPADLDNYIDIVATRVQQQKEYTEVANKLHNQSIDDNIQEEDMTMDELGEFY
ncbi:hypothetical protein [Breznakia pachnodae]|uniref:Uncharacterized protein n=1 Tax=Breznakia pachnodae TaxID=265178 RepID=A0ABU0E433_9FIRM|nr:hypothetical protein [Breznakia pachnodae]MDQ0361586.1 hypothetical protein [Breznakia pachnodae]